MTVHWCGTGLSAIPGLRRLLAERDDVAVWNRTEGKARDTVGDLTGDIRAFSMEVLAEALAAEDVVVSMLPADQHVPLAELCLEKGAHFVSSSYISPEMRALDGAAKEKGLRFVNEVGLDPGIDHLMAHWLMADYRASAAFSPDNVLSFISYCGGIPKEPNAFRYKFSWSPLGVLKALKSPSVSIRSHSELRVSRPWDALSRYDAPLDPPESFEVYPNRDSLPFMAEYGFEPGWRVKDFVRGTLRLNGWADAWKDVFAEVEALEGKPEADVRLREMADDFWDKHAYAEGEPDRVVLCVALQAEAEGVPVYHKTYVMDAWGDARGSAMARLVSDTVALAVEAVHAHEIQTGVTAAPSDEKLVLRWLDRVNTTAQHLMVVDHLTR
ncbi:saccharopine dehydrogenase family protein [Vannielia litorea]|uniref:saccharopine dehydrogenase family protein n=1 Tax=Vannielia litorea TaxID=1217970 RepID=UPI001BD1B7CF|nr:saccharopine dehydrogenase family protein [Vannielia litorea]MBS8226301.1 saccharopine dehydrogenase [Vannielia litorea]